MSLPGIIEFDLEPDDYSGQAAALGNLIADRQDYLSAQIQDSGKQYISALKKRIKNINGQLYAAGLPAVSVAPPGGEPAAMTPPTTGIEIDGLPISAIGVDAPPISPPVPPLLPPDVMPPVDGGPPTRLPSGGFPPTGGGGGSETTPIGGGGDLGGGSDTTGQGCQPSGPCPLICPPDRVCAWDASNCVWYCASMGGGCTDPVGNPPDCPEGYGSVWDVNSCSWKCMPCHPKPKPDCPTGFVLKWDSRTCSYYCIPGQPETCEQLRDQPTQLCVTTQLQACIEWPYWAVIDCSSAQPGDGLPVGQSTDSNCPPVCLKFNVDCYRGCKPPSVGFGIIVLGPYGNCDIALLAAQAHFASSFCSSGNDTTGQPPAKCDPPPPPPPCPDHFNAVWDDNKCQWNCLEVNCAYDEEIYYDCETSKWACRKLQCAEGYELEVDVAKCTIRCVKSKPDLPPEDQFGQYQWSDWATEFCPSPDNSSATCQQTGK